MWVKKSKKELIEIKYIKPSKKGKFLNYLYIIPVVFIIQLFYHITGISAFSTDRPKSLIEIINYLPQMVYISLVVYLILVIFKIEPFSTDYLYLCEKCNKKKLNIKKGAKCVCGGNYVDISTMKWVEDTEQPKKENGENK